MNRRRRHPAVADVFVADDMAPVRISPAILAPPPLVVMSPNTPSLPRVRVLVLAFVGP